VSVALFLLAITVLIFVHELGHFLAARSVGVRVLCFSIGFGPALARFQYGHTEFRLAVIPLGGYVKMLGDSPGGGTDAALAAESFAAQTPLRRAWIAFAGPLANLLLAWVLFAALVWGVPEEPSTRLEQPAAGTLAATLGIERGDRVMAVDDASVDHWRALEGALRGVKDDDFELVLERAGALRIDAQSLNAQRLSTEPEGAPSVLTAASLGFRPMAKALQIGQVMPQSAAEEAGLQAGDRILSVDGRAVSHSQALIALIQQSPGKELHFRLERGGQDLELVVRPRLVPIEGGSGTSAEGAGSTRSGASSGSRGRIGATLVPEYDMVAVERDLLSVVAAASARDSRWAPLLEVGGTLGASLLLSSYSRENEREADALGQRYMVQAGYPADGMTRLHALLVGGEEREPGLLQTMFSSHPMSRERRDTADFEARTTHMNSLKAPRQRECFMDRTAPMRAIKPTIQACQQGELLLSQKKAEPARERFGEALRLTPSDYPALLRMSECLTALRREREALAYAQQARRVLPQEGQAMRQVAALQMVNKRHDLALQELEAFDRVLPGDPSVSFLRGVNLEATGQKEAALQAFQAFVKSNPGAGQAATHATARIAALSRR